MVELAGLLSNPRDRRIRQGYDQDPEPIVNPFVDLVEAVCDPDFVDRAEKLRAKLEKLKPFKKVRLPKPKPRQGQILKTIQAVMLEHPDGLHTYEARKLVEERLGRRLPKSTVKDALASRAEFVRVGYGRYRLADNY